MHWLKMAATIISFHKKNLFILALYLLIANILLWLCAIFTNSLPNFLDNLISVFSNEINLNKSVFIDYFSNSERQFTFFFTCLYAILYLSFLIGLIFIFKKRENQRRKEQQIWIQNGGTLATWLIFTTSELIFLLSGIYVLLFFLFYLCQSLIRQCVFELNYCFLHHIQQFSLKDFIAKYLTQTSYFQIKLPESNAGLWQLVKQQLPTTTKFQWIYLQNVLFIIFSTFSLHLVLQALSYQKNKKVFFNQSFNKKMTNQSL